MKSNISYSVFMDLELVINSEKSIVKVPSEFYTDLIKMGYSDKEIKEDIVKSIENKKDNSPVLCKINLMVKN